MARPLPSGIRRAELHQAEKIAALIRRTSQETYASIAAAANIDRWLAGLHSVDHVQARIEDPHTCQIVVLDRGCVRGCAHVVMHEQNGHLGALSLDPIMRLEGWGSKLVGARLHWLAKQHATTATTTISRHNHVMRHLIQRHGFVLDGEQQGRVLTSVCWQRFAREVPACRAVSQSPLIASQ